MYVYIYTSTYAPKGSEYMYVYVSYIWNYHTQIVCMYVCVYV